MPTDPRKVGEDLLSKETRQAMFKAAGFEVSNTMPAGSVDPLKERLEKIAEAFADNPEEYIAIMRGEYKPTTGVSVMIAEESERVYKEGAAKRRQEEMEKGAQLLEQAKQAGAALAHYANSRDRLLDSLIETNSYLIKLHEANKFNAQHLLELMRINTINHATIMKEIR